MGPTCEPQTMPSGRGEGVPLCESHGSYTCDVACFSCPVDAEPSEVHAGSGSPAPRGPPESESRRQAAPHPVQLSCPPGPTKELSAKQACPHSRLLPRSAQLPGPCQGFNEEQRKPGPRPPKLRGWPWDPRLCPADAGSPHYDNQSVFPPQTKKAPPEEPWSPAAPSLASAASSLTRSKPRPVFIRGKGRKVQGD